MNSRFVRSQQREVIEFDVLLILGLVALVAQAMVHRSMALVDVPLTVLPSMRVLFMGHDRRIGAIESMGLVLHLPLASICQTRVSVHSPLLSPTHGCAVG